MISLSLFRQMSYRDILKDVPPKKNLKRKKRMKKLKCIHEVYYSSVFLALSFQYYKLSMNLLGSKSVPQILGALNQLIKDECLTYSLLEMLPLAH